MTKKRQTPKHNGHKPVLATQADVDGLKEQFHLEETLTLDDGSDSITIRINEIVAERSVVMMDVLMTLRGIKDPSDITVNDSEVMAAVAKEVDDSDDATLRGIMFAKRAAKKVSKRDDGRWNAVVARHLEKVQRRYRQSFNSLALLVRATCMLMDDVFTVDSRGITSRFDYVPDDDYWENGGIGKLDSKKDSFLELITAYRETPAEIVIDKTNANEVMLALIFALLDANPHLSREVSQHVTRLMSYEFIANRDMEGVELDDFNFLRNQLSAFLYESDGESDSVDERAGLAVRVQPPDGLDADVPRSEPAGEEV